MDKYYISYCTNQYIGKIVIHSGIVSIDFDPYTVDGIEDLRNEIYKQIRKWDMKEFHDFHILSIIKLKDSTNKYESKDIINELKNLINRS